ncbi:hypothetical protein [Shimazuella kribbensis]|uniref:hypothetical protein n=1 Tax=Shimazuella kribbensis TaxID=139808 RepID=UPI00040BB3E9|nr:hypothetical protein [Shimazuella kribbensis]
MKVIIKAEKKRFAIPLPFFLIRITGWIICRKWFWRLMNKRIKTITFPVPLLDMQTIRPILLSLKEYKGVTLVDINDKDGNGVTIRL